MASDSQYPVSEQVGSSLVAEADSGMMQPEDQEACRLHLSRLSPLLRQWLQTCIKNTLLLCLEFPKDSIEARFVPKQVISIGPLDELRTPYLVDTEEDCIEDCRYVALSHAWGTPDEATRGAMTIAVATLAGRKQGISMSTLPKVISRYDDHLSPSWHSISLD